MNNKAQFTPGPWAADGYGILYAAPSEADEFEVIEINAPYNSQDRYLIAQVHAGFTQSQADANLIAAAPAMYEALQNLLEFIKGNRGAREGNPYCKAEVRQALKVLASIQGKKDYLDADTLPQAEGKHD